jgi:Spy/CpxP family protein refolding chaperone
MKPAGRAAAVFILGLVLGAAAGSWGQRAAFHRMMRRAPDHRRVMLDRLTRELGLDEKQREAVSAVTESRMADVDKLKAETFSRLEAIRASADEEMAKILTPEQAAKLKAMHRSRPLRINWEAAPPPPPAR